ncbi:MAG: sensor histidine kinase [Lachnospiraceae bacterium]|nr:sensor histidine kinase [Lachnospiraceae bacterium]MDE6253032.1 sensor histidine kinase [Lachnospiraceae bacterium]
MNKIKMLLKYIVSYKVWIVTILFLNVFFIFLAWIAYPKSFFSLIGLMFFVSFLSLLIPIAILIVKRKKEETAFYCFLNEPDETNEYLLCEATPKSFHSYIHDLGQHMRMQQADLENCTLQLDDYEDYIENWAHEIKKPLSLMTLLLDNRKDEISPFVRTRMLYVRDQARQSVEQVIYFSRLGAAHKDYRFEPLSVLRVCKEIVEDNKSLLEEAGFSIEFNGEEYEVISDKKGLMFILGQLICNSVKYAAHNRKSHISFAVSFDREKEKTILSISDNGVGIPKSDILFVFDKGFTGDKGSYLSRSTGMGLYLVKRMAHDLAIDINVESSLGCSTTFSLVFPKVEH